MNSDGNCSPLNELAVAQFAKPPELGRINLRVLTPFQRCLLAIDGTVTTFIEAYMQEPVEIRRLSQTTVPLIVDHPWLEMPKGAMVVKREVLIEGKYSRTLYVYASSLVVLERLSAAVRQRLDIHGAGLGRILNQTEMGTRREVLWYGAEHAKTAAGSVRSRTNGKFLTRTYRIINKGQPIALVTERFPADIDQSPSHH